MILFLRICQPLVDYLHFYSLSTASHIKSPSAAISIFHSLKTLEIIRVLFILEAQIYSLKALIQRKNIIKSKQQSYQTFIHLFNKLIRLNPYDKKKKQLLREEIESEQGLPIKSWFLEQLE